MSKEKSWRTKTGRPLKFETPEELEDKINEYFKEVDENPITKVDFKGKDAIPVTYKIRRPYTVEGLCLFLGITLQTFLNYESRDGFLEVVTRARMVIDGQKLEGAMTGEFNPNIVARLLGLVDKKSIETNDASQIDLSDLTDDELEILTKLRDRVAKK